MSILSIADAISNIRPTIFFSKTSSVGSASIIAYSGGLNSTGISGIAITSQSQVNSTDFLEYSAPAPGNYHYISRVDVTAAQTSSVYSEARGYGVLLCDVLWGSAGFSVGLGVQNINSVELPPRDINESINGEGVFPFIHATGSSVGAGGGNIFLTYTNSAGVSGRSGQGVVPDGTQGGVADFIGLQSGDIGVKSIQTLEFNVDHISGVYVLYLVRPLVYVISNAWPKSCNGLDNIYLTKIFNNTVFFPICVRAQSGMNFAGSVYLSEG